MNTLTLIIESYKELLEKGDNIELIEKFYADDIIQVENNEPPFEVKKWLLEIELKNIEGVHSFSQKINRMIIDETEELVMGEMMIFFDSKKMGKRKLEEAFIQKWSGGKIIYQKFYYKGFEDAV